MFNIILAVDSTDGIGRKNETSTNGLPWSLPIDIQHFRAITTYSENPYAHNVVIMGYNTWATHPKLLPNRYNCVITSKNLEVPGLTVFNNLDDALNYYTKKLDINKIFLIGGAGLINNLGAHWDNLDKLYLTRVYGEYSCDIKVNIPYDKLKQIKKSDGNLCEFLIYEKSNK